MSAAETGPAGWYPEPGRPGSQRYWDGDRWTEHRAPIAGAKQPRQAMRLTNPWGLWTGIAGGVLAAIGSGGTWIVAGGETWGGLSRDGVLTVILAIAAIVILALANTKRWALITTGILGGLCVLIGIVDVGDISNRADEYGIDAHAGWGLWLTLLSGGAIVIGAIGLNACLEPAEAAATPAPPAMPPKPPPPAVPQGPPPPPPS
jgi:hypothetical protein